MLLVFISLRNQVLDKLKKLEVDVCLVIVFKGEEGDYDKYKVILGDLMFDGMIDGKLVVKYLYKVQQEGQFEEQWEFMIMMELKGNMIYYEVVGMNLGIKDLGCGIIKLLDIQEFRDNVVNVGSNFENQVDLVKNVFDS